MIGTWHSSYLPLFLLAEWSCTIGEAIDTAIENLPLPTCGPVLGLLVIPAIKLNGGRF
jgi:hypothetical protein